MMLEGAGFRADGKRPRPRTPTDLLAQARCSGRVPLVTAVLGASAGHGALVAPMSDFTRDEPARVDLHRRPAGRARVDGRDDHQGGPRRSRRSRSPSGLDPQRRRRRRRRARPRARLPRATSRRRRGRTRRAPTGGDDGPRLVPEILDIVPRNGRRVYDMRKVLDVVFDAGSCFEVQPDFGRSGHLPRCAGSAGTRSRSSRTSRWCSPGSIDADGADKAAHFITVADSFHLPLVFLVRQPRRAAGQRVGAGRRSCARAPACTRRRRWRPSPKFEVTLRKAYGFGSMVMGMIPFDGQSAVFAFPGATMGAMGAAAMSRARGSDEDEAAHAARGTRSRRRTARRRRSASTSSSTPARSATCCSHSLERALHRRQAPAEPVARIGITP